MCASSNKELISSMEGGCAQGFFSPELLEPPRVQLLKCSATSWGVSSGKSHQMHQDILPLYTAAIPCPIWVSSVSVSGGEKSDQHYQDPLKIGRAEEA